MAWKARSSGHHQRPFFNSSRQQGGFVIVSALFLLPLLFSLFVGIAFLSVAIRNRTLLISNCRKVAVEAQEVMGQNLEALLALNSRAETLRTERKAAEIQVRNARLSMNPKLIAAAELIRWQVIQFQLALRARQLSLLKKSEWSRKKLKGDFKISADLVSPKNLRQLDGVQDLAVNPTPKNDLTPSYLITNNFTSRQSLGLRWEFDLLEGLPQGFLLTALPMTLISKAQCAATLKRKEDQWIPALTVVKF